MIEQLQNTEEKRQNYVSAIQYARNIKELPVFDSSDKYKRFYKSTMNILLFSICLTLVITLGRELRQPFALLSAGISPFAEQTHIADVQSLSPSKWVSTKTLSGESIAVLLELQDNGIWEVAETKLLDSN